MSTNRLLNEKMPRENFKKLVQEYVDYIDLGSPMTYPIKECKPGLSKSSRIESVLTHIMNTRSVYKPGLALIPYTKNIEKHTLPETINADILADGTKAFGYIGSIINDTTVYPPYPKGDSYHDHINKKIKIACTYGTFALYDGYVYLACHVDEDHESYIYVPVQSILWDFSNPVSLLLYELLYYSSTTIISSAYDNQSSIMQLKPTPTNYLKPLEFCHSLILQLDGNDWQVYQGLQSVWSKYTINGTENARAHIKTGNFANVFKDAFEAIKTTNMYLNKYEQELSYLHTSDIFNRDKIVNIIRNTRQNFEDIVSEFNKLRFDATKIILTYFDGSVLSVIKILHELLKYADSKFGSFGTSRLLHDNIRIDNNIYQFDDEAISRIMRPLHALVDPDELSDGTMGRMLHNLGEIGYVVTAVKNLQTPYLQLIQNLFMPGPILIKIIQREFIQREVGDYTVRNGLEASQFNTIKVLPSIHTKRYLDNVLDPTLTINFSLLTPTYSRTGNQAWKASPLEYCAKPYVNMETIATPERDAFKMFKATYYVLPDPPRTNNDNDDLMGIEELTGRIGSNGRIYRKW